MVYKVNRYFLQEKAFKGPLIDPSKALLRTSQATDVSVSTVKRICSKFNKVRHTPDEVPEPEFFSPKKRIRQRPVTNVSDADISTLRKTVLSFYERREMPTLEKIKENLKQKISFNGSIESLRTILLQTGFRFRKIDGRKTLLERSDVAAARSRFLREMRQLSQSHENFVYIDETWVDQNFKDTTGAVAKASTGKGSRLIILQHAGTKDGFVNNGSLVFQCKNDSDYHKKINAEVFEDWFRKQLLPNIAQNSVIIMDNASYHCKLLDKEPTILWQKSEIQDWLKQNY